MAKSVHEIKYQSVGSYRGVDMFLIFKGIATPVFVIWLDKFYSSTNAVALYDMVDAWWRLRMN